jgi:hypothetical protein
MAWVLAAGVAWLLVALLVGVLVGRGIRLADSRDANTAAAAPNFVVDTDPPVVGPPESTAVTPAPRPTPESTSDRQHRLA